MKEFHESKLRETPTEGDDPFFVELIALLDKYKMDVSFFAGVGNFDEEGPALYTSVLYGDRLDGFEAVLMFHELRHDIDDAIKQELRDQRTTKGDDE
jgi:hypothetical protein